MIMRKIQIGLLLKLTVMLVISVEMSNNIYAQESSQTLDWSIEANKSVFYPGEPVLLTLSIKNTGIQEEKVNFGMDGIEAFSMEIRNSNDNIVSKGEKIQRGGLSRLGTLLVSPGKMSQKTIILNQWCSTLLPLDQYRIICNVEYYLRSESKKKEGSDVYKAGPIHKTQLWLDIQIVEIDRQKFKDIIDNIASVACETEPIKQNKREWLMERDQAREMLAFTESVLAIPYQLQLLRVEQYTWLKRDIINSLVKSGTLEAASGLVQIIEDPNVYKADINSYLIDGVYRLRETGGTEIISATNDFVSKHEHPIISTPID
jgi:hypothetical protein